MTVNTKFNIGEVVQYLNKKYVIKEIYVSIYSPIITHKFNIEYRLINSILGLNNNIVVVENKLSKVG